MKIAIQHGGNTGFVTYDPENKEVLVSHPDPRVRKAVHAHLTEDQEFTLSGSNRLGDFKKFSVKPTQSHEHMLMAMNTLFFHTNVRTNWGHEDNDLSIPSTDINAQADKPIPSTIVKSLDGEDYEIIN